MKAFGSYISYLKTLVADSPPLYSKSERDKRIDMALNGEPNEAIRRSIPRDDLRRYGIFFTNYALANRIINPISASIDQNSIIFDPACGKGDLLISCARRLPLASTLEETILNWGKQLHGYDLHSEFVLAVKYRLALLAMSRRLDAHQMSGEDIEEAFPRIRRKDGLNEEDTYRAASHIIINPPYSMINAPPKCSWASGKVSMAAVFLETCIKNSAPNTRIAAILPDVLRSGSRYFKWRKLIGEMTKINKVEIVGRFNRWVDVDVFIIHLTVGGTAKDRDGDWCVTPPSSRLPKVGDFFEVSVGPVVPHRDPEKGP